MNINLTLLSNVKVEDDTKFFRPSEETWTLYHIEPNCPTRLLLYRLFHFEIWPTVKRVRNFYLTLKWKNIFTKHILHCFSHTISNQTTWLEYYCINNLSCDDHQNCKVQTLEISLNNAVLNLLWWHWFRNISDSKCFSLRNVENLIWESNKNLNQISF